MSLRIGFSGPSGSGKTTLAKWLSETKGIPFIANSAGLIVSEEAKETFKEKYGYKQNGHAEVIRLSNIHPEFGREFQWELLKQRVKLLGDLADKGESFIVDRTMIDNMVYFLLQCGHTASLEETKEYLSWALKAYNEIFTHVFLVKPNQSWTEDNGSRVSNNYWQNFAVYPTFERVFEEAKASVPLEPKTFKPSIDMKLIDFWDLEKRKNFVQWGLQTTVDFF